MGNITILDGGMGRLLEKMGAPFRQPEWSALPLIEAPEYIEQAHQAFIEVGADVITTNTYAVVPFHIGQDRFEKNGKELVKLAASIARKTADNTDRNIKVAGCLPPAFGSYRPDFFDKAKAKDIYAPLIEEQDPYVDFWLAETVSSIEEFEFISSLLSNSKKDLWVAFTLTDRDNHQDIPTLRSGEKIEHALQSALDKNVKAIIFNCSQLEEMSPALNILKNINCPIPYGVYANAFPAIKKDQLANEEITQLRADACPENYLKVAKEWKELGATIIGGCCGIGPDHIRALKSLNH